MRAVVDAERRDVGLVLLLVLELRRPGPEDDEDAFSGERARELPGPDPKSVSWGIHKRSLGR